MKLSNMFGFQSEEGFFTSMCSTFDVQEVYRGNSSRFQKHVEAALRQHCSCDLFNEVPMNLLILSKEKAWIATKFNYNQLKLGREVHVLSFSDKKLENIKEMIKNCKYSSDIQTHSVLPKPTSKIPSNNREECTFTNQSSCPKCPSVPSIDLLSTYCLAKYAAVVSFSTSISDIVLKEPIVYLERGMNNSLQLTQEIREKDQEKKNDSQTGCLKELIKFMYDVTVGKQGKLIKDSYQLSRPFYCRCSFLDSGTGYGLLLSHKKPKANMLQLSKEVQIYSLPLGETVIPVCPGEPSTHEYSSQKVAFPVLNELKEVSKPERLTQACPPDVQNSCPQCFNRFNETMAHLYCTAARVLLVYVQSDREDPVPEKKKHWYIPNIEVTQYMGSKDYSLKMKVDVQSVFSWKSTIISEGLNENIRCISGSMDIEEDVSKDTKSLSSNIKLDFYMKDGCQCSFLDYPVGYALMFFSKEEAVSKHPVQLTDEVTIIPVPYETLTLPNCL
ncbi:uncharacterized protein LOC143222553 isoform X2 [Tachypleus tridentatus]|uniref:uncharacterized protein LOC143222553 isoform X2 n=1 Tax=Tachypleus tridentatus TaxID=6853 RepID=UPI003FD0094D